MAMTRQQMFSTAYHGLAAQGFERSTRDDGRKCAYRGAAGKRCALGYLIPDAIYKPEWDGEYASSAFGLASSNITAEICDENEQFLTDLQGAHDGARSPAHMIERLAKFATSYGLTIPELPDFTAATAHVRDVVTV